MSELMTRITTLIDAEAPPIDIEELVWGLEATTETAGTSPVRRQRRSTNWAVAVGAAIVVFVLIGGFAWLIGGTEPDVVEEPMPMVTVETTLPPPTTTVPVVPSGLAPETAARADGIAFDFAEHDLCDWFTLDEIREVVTAAYDAEGLTYPIPTELVANPVVYEQPTRGCRWEAVGAVSSPSLVTFDLRLTNDPDFRAADLDRLVEREKLLDTAQPDDSSIRDLMRDGIELLALRDIPNIYVVERDQPLFIGHIPAGPPDVTDDTFDEHVGRWLNSTERQRVQIRLLNAMLERMNWLHDTSN